MSNVNYDALFTPFRIGKCEIRNRVIIPAMEGTNLVENMMGPKFNEHCADDDAEYDVARDAAVWTSARNSAGADKCAAYEYFK